MSSLSCSDVYNMAYQITVMRDSGFTESFVQRIISSSDISLYAMVFFINITKNVFATKDLSPTREAIYAEAICKLENDK